MLPKSPPLSELELLSPGLDGLGAVFSLCTVLYQLVRRSAMPETAGMEP